MVDSRECFSRRELEVIGHTLESGMEDTIGVLEVGWEGMTMEEKRQAEDLEDKIREQFKHVFSKIKFNACDPETNFEQWKKLFGEERIPWL